MLTELFSNGFAKEAVIQIILLIPVIIISLTVHEYCHGYAAYKCGDPTARNLGRLTLNPIKHLDPIGTIMMLVFGFGYAKPVPINTRNFEKPRRDICIVSVVGPLSNVLLCFFGVLVYRGSIAVALNFSWITQSSMPLWAAWSMFCTTFIVCNASLAVFNLLPIPPLDGSRLLSVILPPKAAYTLARYENYIMLGLIVLLYLGKLDGIISYLGSAIVSGLDFVISLIPFLNF